MAEGGISRKGSEAEMMCESDDFEMALNGMKYLLNNDWDKALELFSKYKDVSPLMCAGNSWVTFVKAVMTFEDDQLQQALKVLQETEKKCTVKNKVFKSFRRKISKKKSQEKLINIEDKLQKQIIVADCVIHQAVLTFLNQDIPSYIKGSWLLRRSYKIYDKLYKEISEMYSKSEKNQKIGMSSSQLDFVASGTSSPQPSDITAEYQVSIESTSKIDESMPVEIAEDVLAFEDDIMDEQPANIFQASAELSTDSDKSNGSHSVLMSHDTIERLLGSVSLGYGAFQLAISFIPPKILKVIEFFGFEGDREAGLKALEFANMSNDMKAPLASLGLLWYHTVIRPFFALDGAAIDAGVEDSIKIIKRCEKLYPNSGLFMFFKARAYRLRSELELALTIYTDVLKSCAGQREMELICCHEIGWINLMKLNTGECVRFFSRLKAESKWSKTLYCYLQGITTGAQGDLTEAKKLLTEVPTHLRAKNNQMEMMVIKRAEKFTKRAVQLTKENCTLYILEVVYLWNSISSCPITVVEKLLRECNRLTDKSQFHIKCLIEGALYRQKGDDVMSIQCFEEAIARQEGNKEDTYVAAYSMYELGISKSQQPETYEEGKTCLNKVRDNFKEYDFDDRLNVRLNAALQRVKVDGTPI